jgi:hypothetical protein
VRIHPAHFCSLSAVIRAFAALGPSMSVLVMISLHLVFRPKRLDKPVWSCWNSSDSSWSFFCSSAISWAQWGKDLGN